MFLKSACAGLWQCHTSLKWVHAILCKFHLLICCPLCSVSCSLPHFKRLFGKFLVSRGSTDMFWKFRFKEASLFKDGISGENWIDLCQIDRKLEGDAESLCLRKAVWVTDSLTSNPEHSFLRLAFPSVCPFIYTVTKTFERSCLCCNVQNRPFQNLRFAQVGAHAN